MSDIAFIPVDRPGHQGTGSVRTSTLLIKELSKIYDLDVYVFSVKETDRSKLPATDRVRYIINDGLSKLPEPKSSMIASMQSMREQFEAYDLVHSYSMNGIAGLSGVSVPHVVTLNSYGPICPKRDLRQFGQKQCSGPGTTKCVNCITQSTNVTDLKRLYKRLYRIRVVSRMREQFSDIRHYHALAPHIEEIFSNQGIASEKITTIPHFYDETFTVDRKRVSDIGNPVELLYVGAIREKKGVDLLVESLPKLTEADTNFRLRIVGDGPHLSALKQKAKRLDVAGEIEWEGYVPHKSLPPMYAQADVFLYPGLWNEPFGRVLLEALASATPVVGSDVGSVDYIVGEAGMIFERGDSDALACAVLDMISQYNSYVEATERELAKFEKDRIIATFDDLYQRLQDSN